MTIYCARCDSTPCVCEPTTFAEGYEPLEGERPSFEAAMRAYHPDRDMTRYGHTYRDDKVRNRWVGWQMRARFVTARRVR